MNKEKENKPKNKKKTRLILYILILVGLVLTIGLAFKKDKIVKLTENIGKVEEQIVGGDIDQHGCIPSTGYMWCEPKQKCLRQWEESCEELKIPDN